MPDQGKSGDCSRWESRDFFCDDGALEPAQLEGRACFYAERAGACKETTAAVAAMLQSDMGRAIMRLTEAELLGTLVNDAYKPKMHKVYAELFPGVQVDFCLNVRKSDWPPERIADVDPELFAELQQAVRDLEGIQPYTPAVQEALRLFYNFETSQAMKQRSQQNGVAHVRWERLPSCQLVAVASGTAEAASNAETSVTQLVQAFTIRAQVRDLCRRKGLKIDRTEHVANSLGHLAAVVDRLNSLQHPLKGSLSSSSQLLRATALLQIALFAGRRSSDRAFLLLQNWFCAQYLHGYIGTSSIYAVCHLDALLKAAVPEPASRVQQIGRLIGTHAHELMSSLQHLTAHYDEQAGSDDAPVQISSMLAHLLFLRCNGGLEAATALPDTFGTQAFVAAAVATTVPDEFVADVQELHNGGRQIDLGTPVFAVFCQWRLDSGSYPDMAEVVVSAWEQLNRRRAAAGRSEWPRPSLMHSNLSDVRHVEEVAQLPERIRPSVLAFGGVADGFVPFERNDGQCEEELHLASVVMKAVQAGAGYLLCQVLLPARHPHHPVQQPCAGKIGDDAAFAKVQVDKRLPEAQQESVRNHFKAMLGVRKVDGDKSSKLLAAAYHDVSARHKFC